MALPLDPRRYARKLYRLLYAVFLHDPRKVEAEEATKFAKIGVDATSALERLNGILQELRGRPFDVRKDSIHWLLFSALSFDYSHAKRILEIGTFDGEFTNILSRLFPNAEITTVDLPESDPLLRAMYNRTEEPEFLSYLSRQKGNLDRPNIRPLLANSFFVPALLERGFDLVWVDGGHLYPEVAWDLCNAFHLCSPGGAVLCDDVIPIGNYQDSYVSSDSARVLEYIAARSESEITLFLKRQDPQLYALTGTRKFVALVRKAGAPIRQ